MTTIPTIHRHAYELSGFFVRIACAIISSTPENLHVKCDSEQKVIEKKQTITTSLWLSVMQTAIQFALSDHPFSFLINSTYGVQQ
jgi:frataxin-like iron-binding protein CyaY